MVDPECIYRGEIITSKDDDVAVYQCGIHEVCTLESNRLGYQSCDKCLDKVSLTSPYNIPPTQTRTIANSSLVVTANDLIIGQTITGCSVCDPAPETIDVIFPGLVADAGCSDLCCDNFSDQTVNVPFDSQVTGGGVTTCYWILKDQPDCATNSLIVTLTVDGFGPIIYVAINRTCGNENWCTRDNISNFCTGSTIEVPYCYPGGYQGCLGSGTTGYISVHIRPN